MIDNEHLYNKSPGLIVERIKKMIKVYLPVNLLLDAEDICRPNDRPRKIWC